MKPTPFRYVAAADRAHALNVLHTESDEVKILAGGQSLLPMMNFRLVRPSIVLDINRITSLGGVDATAEGLRIGALARHREIETSPLVAAHFPVLQAAMPYVAHPAIRNRGTFGGSLCHADPAAELPMLALLLNARILVASVAGTRGLAAEAFFLSALTTALRSDELLTGIELPFLPPGTGWGFAEVARRHGDYALAAVAVTMRVEDARARGVRIAMMGIADRPLCANTAAAELEATDCGPQALHRAADAVRAAVAPTTDLHASADYRKHLAGVLTERAAAAAWQRAQVALI